MILIVLSLVAGQSYRKYIVRSKLTECITHIHYLRRLALEHFFSEGQFPTPAVFLTIYGDDPTLTAYRYTAFATGAPKNCTWADANKGHGNDCDRRDEQNPGWSTGSTGFLKTVSGEGPTGGDLLRSGVLAASPYRYGFELTCTHDHFPVAEYVYMNSVIPNAIIVQMTPTAAP